MVRDLQAQEKSSFGGCLLILFLLLIIAGGAAGYFLLAVDEQPPPAVDAATAVAPEPVAPPPMPATDVPQTPAPGGTIAAVTGAPAPAMGEIGAPTLAPWKSSGWSYPGVIAERSGDRALIVFADGMSDELPLSALRPDGLTPSARVTVTIAGVDHAATIQERSGDAVRVTLDGDLSSHWRAFISVKLRDADPPGPPTKYVAPPPGDRQPGRPVLAVWPKDGKLYPGQVIDRRADGQLFILFHDGTTAWQTPANVRPEKIEQGDRVQILAGPAKGQTGTVTACVGYARRLNLDSGEEVWTSLSRLRLP